MSSTFEMEGNGLCIIRCDPPVNGSDSFVFAPEVIASWKALLGLASTREGMRLPVMSNEADARMRAALTSDDSDVEASSGIDVACTRNIDGLDEFLNAESSKNMLDECEERFFASLMPPIKEG